MILHKVISFFGKFKIVVRVGDGEEVEKNDNLIYIGKS